MTLNRYMFKEFIKGLIISLVILVFIYIIIDLFEDLGKYLEHHASILTIMEFYLYQSIPYAILLLPVAAMLGTFYSLGLMARNNELISLKTSGIPMVKIFLIFPIIGLLLVIASFVTNEYLGTWANHNLRSVREVKILKRKKRTFRMRNFFYLSPYGKLYRIRSLDVASGKIIGFYLWDVDDQLRIRRTIVARSGSYNGSWKLYDVTERIFNEDSEELNHYDTLRTGLIPETPEELAKSPKPMLEMQTGELFYEIRRRRLTGADVKEEAVEFNYRFSSPFINLILILMAIPFALRLKRGGLALGIGIGIIVAFIYWGLIQTFRAYGIGGMMSPFLSAWFPNFIFGTIVIISYLGIER